MNTGTGTQHANMRNRQGSPAKHGDFRHSRTFNSTTTSLSLGRWRIPDNTMACMVQ